MSTESRPSDEANSAGGQLGEAEMSRVMRNLSFRAWLALVHSYGALSKVLDRRLSQELDVSLAWFEVMVRLYPAKDRRLRLLELSQQLIVSKASISKLVDRMERAGLVRRETPMDDRRAVYAKLTEQGEAAVRAALPVQVANIRECFGDLLDEQDLTDLLRILGKVTDHYTGQGGRPDTGTVRKQPTGTPCDQSRERGGR